MANYIKTYHAVLVLHVMVLILTLTIVVFINSEISSIIRESQNEINDNSKDQWALIIGTDNQSSNSFDDAIKISKLLRSLWGKECVSLALTSNKSTIEWLAFPTKVRDRSSGWYGNIPFQARCVAEQALHKI
jgi:mitochondrial fission protein ELM1